MNILVIGGGASGLASAISLARRGYQVTILERNSKCGKKLLLTGNARCNFWNKKQKLEYYNSTNPELFEKIFTSKKDEVLDFITSLGVIPKVINDCYYPYTNQALTILNALLNTAKSLNIKIETNVLVQKIVKKEKFIVYTDKGCYQASKVVLATGSKALARSGSDGNGYKLAQSLGHTIVEVLPSLTRIKINSKIFKDLKGVRSEVSLELMENGKLRQEEKGELLFTEEGLSGICIFNLSGIIAKGLKHHLQEVVRINFVPWFQGNDQELADFLSKQLKTLKNYSLGQVLEGFLNYKIVNVILKEAQVSNTKNYLKEEILRVAKLLKHLEVVACAVDSYEEAQVCSGGVPLREINVQTMESLKTKGLYLVGELLDVDGKCGGYNLGFAWLSALTLGDKI